MPGGAELTRPACADNAHIVQTRLILLDAPLVFFMAASFYTYIRFYKLRYRCAVHSSSHTSSK
mgnify:CR=1 FL=1